MALTIPLFGAVAYSASGGTTVSPAYPANVDYDQLVLIIGMKPSTANSGSVTDPTDWTLVTSITGAGGYGTTLGADTGNTNLFVYTRTVPATGGLTGSLSVTVSTNNVCWATIGRIRSDATNPITVSGWTSSDTTAGNVSASFATNTSLAPDDVILGAMCIPTDVGGGTQFSAQALSATGVTFGTVTEVSEPNSGTGNDIGGFIIRSTVSSGTSNGDTTLTATAGGTTTNVRGPLVLISVREVFPNAYTLTINSGSYSYTGTSTSLLFGRDIIPNSGSYTYTGTAVNLAVGRRLNLNSGSYAYTGTSANLLFGRDIIADSGSYSYTGTSVNLTATRSLTVNSGAYTYTGTNANVNVDRTLSVDSGSYSYTGTDASILYGRTLTANSGSYTYTGTDVTLTYSALTNYVLTIDSGSYSYTGTDIGLSLGRSLALDSGSYAYTGTSADLLYGRKLSISAGAYTYTGTSVTLTYVPIERNIYQGVTQVSKMYLGTSAVSAVYVGTEKVFG